MELRLATFNLENLGLRPDEDTEAARAWLPIHLKALRAMLRRLDADAVAFQELLDPSLLPALVEGLGYAHVAVSEDGVPSPLRVGVVSRHPLRKPAAVATRADLCATDRKTGLEIVVKGRFSRPALEVCWCVPGAEIHLVVVHWKSKIPSPIGGNSGERARWESLAQVGEGRLASEVMRLSQAVELRRVVDRHLAENPDACLAVLGDFNDTLDSEAVRIVRGDARSARAPQLVSRELVPCELAVPSDLRFTQIFRGQREMLDHIFLSRGLMPRFVSARVLNEELSEADEGPSSAPGTDRDWSPNPYVSGSDHAPFVVTFKV